ncbi:T9SS type A sorting domain-containing protein [Salibacter sp.]|uniref:T9SS type A sorting domain-containing protein n=1 Tax=Salibacter sp. TaxID=2010995 RepID=UPI0028704661|nr:T9SS type A sorting domain-containing protein [Salibacter sp.]MDR9397548.1 T9SS type A sorting domain-containing protein [Salibacter sp.]MDR9486964.1 T9SS type A sorting domain-containing protein [Salibacter sp.]
MKIPFHNLGQNNISQVLFSYEDINENNSLDTVSWSGNLAPGNTDYFYLSDFDISGFGTYEFLINSELQQGRVDSDSLNDTMMLELNILQNPMLPASQTFLKCAEDSLQIDVTSQDIDTYQWSNGSFSSTPSFVSEGSYNVSVTGLNGCENSQSYQIDNYLAPSPILPADTFICEGDHLEIVPDSSFISYEWVELESFKSKEVISDSGNYTLNVQDTNGCDYSDEINIDEIPLPQPAVPEKVTGCEGDSLIINADNGSSEPMTYMWGNGAISADIQVTNPGVYYVTVENNDGCASFDSVHVELKPLPSIDLPDTAWMCNGSPELVSVDGIASTFYSWNSGENGMSILVEEEGSYEVTALDTNGCMNSKEVSVFDEVVLNNIDNDTILCEGDGFSVSPDSGYISFWEDGFSNHERFITNPGDYIYTVEGEHGCINQDTLSVESNTVPETNFNYIVGGSNIDFQNLTTNYDSLVWDFDDGQTSTQNSPSHSFSEFGEYQVVLTTFNVCGQSNNTQHINFTSTGIEELFNEKTIKLYPNPVLQGNEIKLLLSDLSNKDLSLRVYSSIGQLMIDRTMKLNGPRELVSINTNQLASGNYVVHLTIDNESVTKMVSVIKRK